MTGLFFLESIDRLSEGKFSASDWKRVKDIYWFIGVQRRGKHGSKRKWFDVIDYLAFQACYLDIIRGGKALEIEEYCEDDQMEILEGYSEVISGFLLLINS